MVSSIGNDSNRTMSMASTIAPSSIAPSDRTDTQTLVQRTSMTNSVNPMYLQDITVLQQQQFELRSVSKRKW